MYRPLAVTPLFVVAMTGIASAQTPEQAAARELFKAGLVEMKDERYSAACPRFAEAHRLDPNVGYVVNLARCEGKLGHLLRALGLWDEAVDLARDRQDSRVLEVLRGRETLRTSIPKIEVDLGEHPAPGVAVTIDDVPAAGKAVAVDPGTHHIRASAPKRISWQIELDTQADGATHPVRIPELEVVAESTIAATATRSVEPPRTGATQRVVGVILAGAGVVALGTGSYFALRAISKNDQASSVCSGGQCQTEEGVRLRGEAVAAGDMATVTFVTGGAAVISGIVLWLTAPKASVRGGTARLEAAPRMSREGAGVVLGGSW